MKAWLLPQLGSIDLLSLSDMPDPTPGLGEVVLDLEFAALNPADRYLAEGAYPARPSFPHILGRDGIGRICAIGEHVHGWKAGDEAVILRSEIGVSRAGTFAERVSVPVESLVKPPETWSREQAAGATLVYLTAWQALTQWGDLPPSAVLITGASGGVGVASIQLAKAMGHTVIGLSRGESKRQPLLDLGADVILDPNDTQWRKQVRQFLGEKRVDLVIDNIGGPLFGELIDTLGMWGKVSVVGRLAGPTPQFNTSTLFFRRLRIGGVAVGTYTPAESQAAWTSVTETLHRANAVPQVDRVFPFDDLPAAFARLREGPLGKVVLKVR